MYTKNEVKDYILELIDPSVEKSFRETGGLKHLDIDEEKMIVTVIIGLEKLEDDYKKYVTRQLAKLIKLDLGYNGIKSEFELNKKSASILGRQVKYIGEKVGIIDADIYGSSIPTILDMPITLPKGTDDEKIVPFNKDGIELISTEFFLQPDKPLMWRGPMLGKMLNHFFYDVVYR